VDETGDGRGLAAAVTRATINEPRPRRKEHTVMAVMLVHYNHDYDEWKGMFDADPVGRAQSGVTGHTICRGVDDPNDIVVQLEFASLDDAKAFRDRLVGSGVIDRLDVRTPPIVLEVTETRAS
jgi:hypothetical protein